MKAELPEFAAEPQVAAVGRRAMADGSVITRMMAEKLARPDMLSLAAGFTDNRLLPVEQVRSVAAELMAEDGASDYLQYGMNRGRPQLRAQVLELLRSYPGEAELSLNAEQVVITNGSQQGLYLLTQLFCEPGDIVLVERPSYFVYLELLRGLGVHAMELPCAQDGALSRGQLDAFFNELAAAGQLSKVRFVYLMGTYANPSTRCISEASKAALGEALRRLPVQLPVIEDMAYRELYFNQPDPARSLLALPDWDDWPVFYAGTFTKPFATGLKIGFIASRADALLDGVAAIKGHHDFGSGHLSQAIIERLLQSGGYPDHLAGIRTHYAEKCALLESALLEGGLDQLGWRWDSPQGGLLMWLTGPQEADTRIDSPFYRLCLENEVSYVPGDLCFASGQPFNCVRLSFGALESERIPEAARRFCLAAAEFARR